MKMKNINILIALIVLATMMTGCVNGELEGLYNPTDATAETSSVITLTTDRTDGIVKLSIDAPENKRSQLWIDLNGDGVRSKDGSEDISVFNTYQDYTLAEGLKSISVYGDINYLASASNKLTAIDVSGNPFLTTLNTPLNKITALDVSKNSALTHLDCSNNNINTLNVSQNRALVSLWAFSNNLTQLDLSINADLVSLDFSGNQLNSIDVSKNRELVRLIGFNNQLTSLDISQNEKLNRLWLFGNPFPDKETERITSMMKELGKIDLWISDLVNVLP